MPLNIVFDEAAIAQFRISNNFKQNIDETHSKQPKIHRKIHTSLWILEISKKICKPKVLRLSPSVSDFQKENHTDLKIYRKPIA
jgi:hypothetical protein